MATISRSALTSQQQRKRPIGRVDQSANLLLTTLASTPASLDLPLLSAKIFDSAPRRGRWQTDCQQSEGFIIFEVPNPEIVALYDSAPARIGELSIDQPANLLATTLGQPGLLLLASRLSPSAPSKRRQLLNEIAQRPLTLSLQFLLQVADALHAHPTDEPTLQLAGTLEVGEALHGHTADEIALQQAGTLSIANALHGHTVESVTLSTGLQLVLEDALHEHLADQPPLTQAHVVVVSEAMHGHTADLVAIFNPEALVVNDALHAHLCDALGIARSHDSSRRVVVVAVSRIVRVH